MIAGGKGGGNGAPQAPAAGGGNMLSAILGSPIAQHLSGARPPAPDMAGQAFSGPTMPSLARAQQQYWSERNRQQKGMEVGKLSEAMEYAAEANEPPAPASTAFPSARTSQPSLDDILKAITDQANRYRTGRR